MHKGGQGRFFKGGAGHRPRGEGISIPNASNHWDNCRLEAGMSVANVVGIEEKVRHPSIQGWVYLTAMHC